MTEIKLTLEDPALFARRLRVAAGDYGVSNGEGLGSALREAADQIDAQAKAPVEEPTGDCVVFFSLNHPRQGVGWAADDGKWEDGSGSSLPWEQLVGDAKPTDVMLYRRVPYPEPVPSAAEAVEADKAEPQPWHGAPPEAEHRLAAWERELLAEPSPVQVEAEPVECSCYKLPRAKDGVLRHYHGCPNRPSSDLVDPAPAEDDPIEALVQGYAVHTFNVDRPGREELFREFATEHAALLTEVGGQQPGVPVIDRGALIVLLAQKHVGASIPPALLGAYRRNLADDILALLPAEPSTADKEPTS